MPFVDSQPRTAACNPAVALKGTECRAALFTNSATSSTDGMCAPPQRSLPKTPWSLSFAGSMPSR